MILFWCLCVSLVLGGLALRREVRAALEDLRLHLFGVRVRVRRVPTGPAPRRRASPPSRHDFCPPPRVVGRAGP
jgi:hypothetical protein